MITMDQIGIKVLVITEKLWPLPQNAHIYK